MPDKRIQLDTLKQFKPLDRFSDQQLVLVLAKSELLDCPPEHVVMESGSQDFKEYFLLEGSVGLESFDGRYKRIDARTESSTTAIALLQPRKYTVTTLTQAKFLVIDQKTVEALLKELPQDKNVDFSVSDLHSGREVDDIARSFEQDLKTNNLQLPSFPDVAMRIRKLLDDPNVTAQDIANALKNDPAITVKLLKTCNSPLYRSAQEISSAQDAVVRLGFETTRQLVTLFAMRELFASRNPFLQQQMRELWMHSREVAAIAYVLAKITPGMNPELALLAGLIQDIGTIPVLNYIERYPHFMKLEHKVGSLIDQLKSPIGKQLLSAWGFSEALIDVAGHSENWKYDSGQDSATYADIAIVAQLHAYIGKHTHKKLPRFADVPAFSKLGDHGLTPEQSQQVLHDSHEQIDDIKAILSADLIPVLS